MASSYTIEDMSHVANDLLEQMKTSITGIDLGALSFGGANVLTMVILPIILVILGAILIYDLVSLYQAIQLTQGTAGRAMLLSPLLLQKAGNMIGLDTDHVLGDPVGYRSLQSWDPILNGIELAIEKYSEHYYYYPS